MRQTMCTREISADTCSLLHCAEQAVQAAMHALTGVCELVGDRRQYSVLTAQFPNQSTTVQLRGSITCHTCWRGLAWC